MKKLLTILLSFLYLSINAQTQRLGGPNTTIEVSGKFMVDSQLLVTTRDTLWTPTAEGVIDYWPAQHTYYGYRQARWQPFSVGFFEPVITASNTAGQYWTGYKTFATLNTDSITQGSTNKFFSNALARSAISLTTSGSSGPATYNSATGVFNIPSYTTGGSGSIDSVALTMPGIFTVTNSPLPSTGGTIGVTLKTQNNNTFLAGPNTGGPLVPTFRLMTTGDLPVGIPNANLANSNFNLSIGGSGTSPNWTFTTVNLGSSEILNLPIASAVNTGILQASDWITFNSKVTSVNGLFGVVVTKNADSIKHLPVDTTTDRNAYVLSFDSVNHKWYLAPPGSGGGTGIVSVGAIDGNGAFTNGASISGSSIYMQSASVANPGLINNTTQSFSGNKTFIGSLTLTGLTNKTVGATDSAMIRDAAGKLWVTQIGPGGIGGPNVNLGTGYRDAYPLTNNLRTFFGGYAQKIDSTSNANGLTFYPDTTLVIPYTDTSKVNGIPSKTWVSTNFVSLFGSYSNPAWISGLAWSKITGAPAFTTLSSFSATTPVLYNNSTGVFSFATSGVGAGSCTNCNLTYDVYGRLTAASNGSGGSGGTNNNVGSFYRLVIPTTNNIKTVAAGYGLLIDSTSNANALTFKLDSAHLKDTIYAVEGLSVYGTHMDSIGLGGPLFVDATISGNYGLTFSGLASFNLTNGTIDNKTATSTDSAVIRDAAGRLWSTPTLSLTTLGSGAATYTAATGVLNIPNPYAVNSPNNTVKGNVSGGPAIDIDITATQVTAMLNLATTSLQGLVPAWPNDATKYFDGTGHYSVPAGGGGSSTLTRQNITSGTSAIVTGGRYLVQFNFASVAATYTLTLPASPSDQDVVDIQTGTTIAAPGAEITSFTLLANSGQTLNFYSGVSAITFYSGTHIKVRYNSTGAFWDRTDNINLWIGIGLLLCLVRRRKYSII